MRTYLTGILCIVLVMVLSPRLSYGKPPQNVLTVGPGKDFPRIEDAVKAAQPNTEIVVYPQSDGQPYRQTQVLIRKSGIRIRSASARKPIVLDGTGFNYSGQGSVPRAIVQFDSDANGGRLEGFVLQNAHNESHNGAGIRINQANDVVISRCLIQNNDMGIMSGGSASQKTGANQRIENCKIVRNGAPEDPGYNHNLYLGGHSVFVSRCEIADALTGHNLKSRAHLNTVEKCFIHGAANREIDFVDAKDGTDVPGSDSVLRNNRIVKDPNCSGNRTCIHFGQDGGNRHDGALVLENNTIETPFQTPIVDVSDGVRVVLNNNQISDAGANARGLVLKIRAPESVEIKQVGNRIPKQFRIVGE